MAFCRAFVNSRARPSGAGTVPRRSSVRVAPCRAQALGVRDRFVRHGLVRDCLVRDRLVPHALPPEFKASIDEFVGSNKIVVFMKGNKQMPQCGFSNTVVQILNQLGVPYVTVDILENDMLRAGMKEYSMWPTFPQVYVDGAFYGGCDIVIEGFQSGELAEVLEIALNS